MGQQAGVLPPPLDEQTTTTPLATADDLLSQLAGEEIDRLLAESDAETAALPPPLVSEPVVTPLVADAPTARVEVPVDLPAAPTTRGPASEPSVATPTLQPVEAPVAPFRAESAAAPTAPVSSTSTPPPPATEKPFVEFNKAAAPPPPAAATATATTAAVPEPAADDETEAATSAAISAAIDGDPSDADGSLPIYLKPLEWLNAPLAACPEPAREVLGKIAILTLVNAIGVLVYVIFFRKH